MSPPTSQPDCNQGIVQWNGKVPVILGGGRVKVRWPPTVGYQVPSYQTLLGATHESQVPMTFKGILDLPCNEE